jgi:hypothetical protein
VASPGAKPNSDLQNGFVGSNSLFNVCDLDPPRPIAARRRIDRDFQEIGGDSRWNKRNRPIRHVLCGAASR